MIGAVTLCACGTKLKALCIVMYGVVCIESRDDSKYFSKSILFDQNELICVNRRACFALVRALSMALLVCTPQGLLPFAAEIAEEHTRFQLNQYPKTKILAFPVTLSHLISFDSN